MEAKVWYKSKTMWFNLGTILVAVTAELTPLLGFLSEETATVVTPLVLIAAAVGNIILRSVTTQPVTARK